MRLIQRKELSLKPSTSNENETPLLIKIHSGETLSFKRTQIHQIFSSFIELTLPNSLTKASKLHFTSSQIHRLTPLIPLSSSEIVQKSSNTKKMDSNQPSLSSSLKMDWVNGENWAKKAQSMDINKGIQSVKIPRTLRAKLRDYQKEGVNWLQFLAEHQLGGVLADDMGLGKTIQTLAHLLVEKKQGRLCTPCLVVSPKSVISNWDNECEKFAPSLKRLLLVGGNRHVHFSTLHEYDLIITSYGLLSKDIHHLLKISFHVLILDEAQMIKNTRSKISQMIKTLHSKQRLCLTGTPMENHLGELWSLFQFLMPNFLGNEYQFNQLYRQPIEKNHDYHRQSLLAHRVAPLMLRRIKNDVARELPPKTEMTVLIPLEKEQADLYEFIRASMLEHVEKNMALESKKRHSFLMGNALLKLRQICCHSHLLSLASAKKINSSGKLKWLKNHLPTMVKQGRRILLFSSFTSMLSILSSELKIMKIPFLILTGKSTQRGELVKKFQEGKTPIFLISLKAGGVGLNLTAADTVIHYDPWWNPAAEQQANDRAYRIGQEKAVFVYKLITEGSVEEKIQRMQNKKKNLAQELYHHSDLNSSNLMEYDWKALFQPIEMFE
jgi:SNF2 family DNA or RNA helicase